jgi:D-alanine-D-alanine ligase
MTHVLLLYNQPLLPRDHPDAESEHTVVANAQCIEGILRQAGYQVRLFGLGQNPADLLAELDQNRPDVVVNLFEGNLDNTETESYVAGLLEWKGIPFTGSPMATLSLCRPKHLTKHLLRGAGLPTADFFVVDAAPLPPCHLDFPVIAKPACQDASVGLDQKSVCTNYLQLEERVRYLLQTYGPPVLVEEYIRGREFNVALLELPELQYLPLAEIVFPQERPGFWPILTYNGKWKPGHPEFDDTPPRCPADIDPEQAQVLGEMAMKVYRLMGCRDYARVDFRLRDEQAYILEVNPNPDITESAGYGSCLRSAGLRYPDFIIRVVENALNRPARPKPTFAMERVEWKEAATS